mmetsp:Transcript_22865/g.74016  ORF Transcript_22865/g.74016 Transcript_22865/m.74016 type:complete len:245 (-) Transcript_22865:788-1522(-)
MGRPARHRASPHRPSRAEPAGPRVTSRPPWHCARTRAQPGRRSRSPRHVCSPPRRRRRPGLAPPPATLPARLHEPRRSVWHRPPRSPSPWPQSPSPGHQSCQGSPSCWVWAPPAPPWQPAAPQPLEQRAQWRARRSPPPVCPAEPRSRPPARRAWRPESRAPVRTAYPTASAYPRRESRSAQFPARSRPAEAQGPSLRSQPPWESASPPRAWAWQGHAEAGPVPSPAGHGGRSRLATHPRRRRG